MYVCHGATCTTIFEACESGLCPLFPFYFPLVHSFIGSLVQYEQWTLHSMLFLYVLCSLVKSSFPPPSNPPDYFATWEKESDVEEEYVSTVSRGQRDSGSKRRSTKEMLGQVAKKKVIKLEEGEGCVLDQLSTSLSSEFSLPRDQLTSLPCFFFRPSIEKYKSYFSDFLFDANAMNKVTSGRNEPGPNNGTRRNQKKVIPD